MFKAIEGLPKDVLGVEASGEVTHADYHDWLIPRAEAMMGRGPVRMFYVIGKDFTGFDLRALADDAGFGIAHLRDFSRIAVVSDHVALNAAVSLFKPFFHGEARAFRLADIDKARDWITAASPQG